MSSRSDVEAALTRTGRRCGWLVSAHGWGYYKLRFFRSDGTVLVRTGPGGRITEAAVTVGDDRYLLTLPDRRRVEEVLLSPPRRPRVDPADGEGESDG